ncbi:unnamed protein product [Thelazia callipaeda]|uniref:PCI domain-containing protein n=1 Tax=Thelazia callipaeda TaxID=103827 RepID=A0A0N5DAP1_THECL|nr:unnamed protein product [Thelazia callipaeda]
MSTLEGKEGFTVHQLEKVDDENELRRREDLIMQAAEQMSKSNDIESLTKLLTLLRPHLLTYGKAKAAKLIRNLIDLCLKIDRNDTFKLKICTEYIQWAKQQNRIFLRHMLEVRLMRLLYELGRYTEVLATGVRLTAELKKIENKDVQLEAYLEESKAAFALKNLSRSRTALVAARTIANSLFIDEKLQGQLDMQSGILNMAEDCDFKTAFSYFYEAFEKFDTVEESASAQKALKYMCLTKIMSNEAAEVPHLLSDKLAVKYSSVELNAMQAIAAAFQHRSLQDYYKAFDKYRNELESDLIIRRQMDILTDAMLEKDICRAIEPYSLTEMSQLAKTIHFPVQKVEKKLAQMILDKKIRGVIDQQEGTLTVYEKPHDIQDKTFTESVKVIRALSKTVDEIYYRASTL